MYQLITAYVHPRGPWMGSLEKDISSEPIREVFAASLKVILVLSNPLLAERQTLDLDDIQDDIYQLPPDLTTQQWLEWIGNAALPTRPGVPTIETDRVRSVQAFIAGWEVTVWDKSTPASSEYNTGPGHDVRLRKARVDDGTVPGDYLLASVNGCMHITDYNSDAIYIEGAGLSTLLSAAPSIQLHSFAKLGKVKQIPFTHTTYAGLEGKGKKDGIWVQLPEDIGNRTVMISIGGILHTDPQYWGVTGDRAIFLDWMNLGIRETYLTTRELISWDKVETLINVDEGSIDGFEQSSFYSDATIDLILEMPQSFIVIIDHDMIKTTNLGLESADLPGKYYHEGEVDYPLRLGNGLLPAFVPIRERVSTRKPVWVIGCSAFSSRRYNRYSGHMNTEIYDFIPSITESSFPFTYQDGYLLSIEGIRLIIPPKV